jgi:hypothetical protein
MHRQHSQADPTGEPHEAHPSPGRRPAADGRIAHTRLRAWLATIALLFIVSAMVVSSAANLDVGLADNGDYARSYQGILSGPVGFGSEDLAPHTPGWHRRYFSCWHDRWQVAPEPAPVLAGSVHRAVLALQVRVSSWLSGEPSQYSMMLGSLPLRLVHLVGALAFLLAALRPFRLASLLAAVPAALLVADSAFAAWFNSMYEEQVALACLPLMLALLLRARPGWWQHGLLFGVVGLVALTKPLYFALPAIVLSLAAWPSSWLLRAAWAAAIVALQAASAAATGNEYGPVYRYHALYHGALMVLDADERAGIDEVRGRPVHRDLIGKSAFEPGVAARLAAVDARYADVVAVACARPVVVPRLVREVFARGRAVIPRLGKERCGAPPAIAAPPPLWSRAFDLLRLNVVACAVGGCLVLVRLWQLFARRRPFDRFDRCITALFLLGASQYLMALGDGLYEVDEHVVLGNLAWSWLLIAAISAGASLVGRSRADPSLPNAGRHAPVLVQR